jgi:ribose 5-phosphate isomerase A
MPADPHAALKQAAAERAVELVQSGMVVGLGTGSTAIFATRRIGALLRDGTLRDVTGFPTSKATADEARALGIPLLDEDCPRAIDLTIDGADEVDPQLDLIKGGGGALLLEKIVASSSRHVLIIADASKKVKTLGAFPLPIEVVPFGIKATGWKIERAFKIVGVSGKMVLRVSNGKPFVTDGGHAIIDCALGKIPDAPRLAGLISTIPGVVDHGLFIGLAGIALIGTDKGVKTFKKPG